MVDVANALCFCHKNHILHLDIKPQNILIELKNNSNKSLIKYTCKLCDFGCSLNVMTENCHDCQSDQRVCFNIIKFIFKFILFYFLGNCTLYGTRNI